MNKTTAGGLVVATACIAGQVAVTIYASKKMLEMTDTTLKEMRVEAAQTFTNLLKRNPNTRK